MIGSIFCTWHKWVEAAPYAPTGWGRKTWNCLQAERSATKRPAGWATEVVAVGRGGNSYNYMMLISE